MNGEPTVLRDPIAFSKDVLVFPQINELVFAMALILAYSLSKGVSMFPICKREEGEDVPIPTFPELMMRILSVLLVKNLV